MPYLYLWGGQWMMNALLQYLWMWPHQEWVWPVTAIAALLFSLLVWARGGPGQPSPADAGWILLVLAMILASVCLLQRVQAVDPFFTIIFLSLLLSIAYAVASRYLGLPLLGLSLWLFALTAVVCLRYLGYAPTALGFFAGLSLMACGWMIRRWNAA